MGKVLPAPLTRALRVRPAGRPLFATASAAAYVLLAVTGATTAALLASRGLRLVGPEWASFAVIVGVVVMIAWTLRGRGLEPIATAIEAWGLWTAISVSVVLATYAVAAGAAPLADPVLAAMDRSILPGFDWPGTMRALAAHPWTMAIADACYRSLTWQPGLLLVACAATGRAARCWTFVIAWTATLALVVAAFWAAPGLGPYAHYGLARADVPTVRETTPWVQPVILHALRDGGLRGIGFIGLEGIVTFPSFHAAASVLLTWAFWPVRLLRWPMAILNAAMLLSAVPIGGHYLVDLPAGMATAAAGIAIASRIERRGDSGGKPRSSEGP